MVGKDFNNSSVGFGVLISAGLEATKLLLSLKQVEMEGWELGDWGGGWEEGQEEGEAEAEVGGEQLPMGV